MAIAIVPQYYRARYALLGEDTPCICVRTNHNTAYICNWQHELVCEITPDLLPSIVLLGDIELSTAAEIADALQGGAAAICTTRGMEVQ